MSYWYAFAGNPNQMAQPGPPERQVLRVANGGLIELTVSFFNETGTYGPTTYAWDFDANGTVDSTAHSPVYRPTRRRHVFGDDVGHQRPRHRLCDQDELYHRANAGCRHVSSPSRRRGSSTHVWVTD